MALTFTPNLIVSKDCIGAKLNYVNRQQNSRLSQIVYGIQTCQQNMKSFKCNITRLALSEMVNKIPNVQIKPKVQMHYRCIMTLRDIY